MVGLFVELFMWLQAWITIGACSAAIVIIYKERAVLAHVLPISISYLIFTFVSLSNVAEGYTVRYSIKFWALMAGYFLGDIGIYMLFLKRFSRKRGEKT